MLAFNLAAIRTIVDQALAHGHSAGFKPLGIVVVDARGQVRMTVVEDGNALLRPDIAHAKAFGCLAIGLGGRALTRMALERPHFINAIHGISKERVMPVPGGVLVRDADGLVVGAVGISGDTSDNDEAAAIAGIEAAGFKADAG